MAGAIRHGDRAVLIDERGELSYKELDERTNALANAWRKHGLEAGEGVAILARNHRGLPRGGVRRRQVRRADRAAQHLVRRSPDPRGGAARGNRPARLRRRVFGDPRGDRRPPRGRLRAWADEPGDDTLDALIDGADRSAPPKPGEWPRITILTSGTTGTPKGAPRSEPRSLSLIGGLLSKVPFRAREVTELCVPMFHALGFMQAIVGVGLGSTLVVRRRFDPEADARQPRGAPRDRDGRRPGDALSGSSTSARSRSSSATLSALRIIFVSGSALGADLAKRATRAFGPVIYNLYGSTEVAYATIATPEDLEAEPSSVGKVVRGSVVKILDEDGEEVPAGRDRPDLRRQPLAVRGLHRRRQQGQVDGPDVLRRRRPLRLRGPAVHRRTRRRDDRLGRRERVPGRGRGAARRATRRSRRRRRSASRTRSSGSG